MRPKGELIFKLAFARSWLVDYAACVLERVNYAYSVRSKVLVLARSSKILNYIAIYYPYALTSEREDSLLVSYSSSNIQYNQGCNRREVNIVSTRSNKVSVWDKAILFLCGLSRRLD